MGKISAVYKIVNTVTGDFYVGSSKDVKDRWVNHKCPSMCKKHPNNKMYQDMQKYGVDKFRLQILAPVMEEHLKQVEQEFIEMLKPTYNNYNAKGFDVERRKASMKKGRKKYKQSEKGKEVNRKYLQTEKGKEVLRKAQKKYYSQMCSYNGETLTLGALRTRFSKAGIPHPVLEARKYLEEK